MNSHNDFVIMTAPQKLFSIITTITTTTIRDSTETGTATVLGRNDVTSVRSQNIFCS